jgi:DNA primase
VVAAIQQKRDLILSAVMKRTSHVLAMIRDGKRRQVLTAMQETLGAHDKRRCNDYLSLMYLMTLAGASDDANEPLYGNPHTAFVDQVRRINEASRETARGANPIAAALDALFNAWRNAVRLDEKAKYDPHERAIHVSSFIERYHLSSFEGDNMLVDVTVGQLCTAFGVIARQFGLNCQYKNAVQLGKRLRNDMEIIQEAGYEIATSLNRTKTILYAIRRLDT